MIRFLRNHSLLLEVDNYHSANIYKILLKSTLRIYIVLLTSCIDKLRKEFSLKLFNLENIFFGVALGEAEELFPSLMLLSCLIYSS